MNPSLAALFVSLLSLIIWTDSGLTCDCGLRQNSRVLKGNAAEKHQYPWMVQVKSEVGSCGGSVISDLYILTAAHCVRNRSSLLLASDLTVTVGMHDLDTGTDVSVSEYRVASKYNPIHPIDYDIAILKLSAPLTFGKTVFPICLPAESREDHFQRLTVAGWGVVGTAVHEGNKVMVSPWELQHAELHYIDRKYTLFLSLSLSRLTVFLFSSSAYLLPDEIPSSGSFRKAGSQCAT